MICIYPHYHSFACYSKILRSERCVTLTKMWTNRSARLCNITRTLDRLYICISHRLTSRPLLHLVLVWVLHLVGSVLCLPVLEVVCHQFEVVILWYPASQQNQMLWILTWESSVGIPVCLVLCDGSFTSHYKLFLSNSIYWVVTQYTRQSTNKHHCRCLHMKRIKNFHYMRLMVGSWISNHETVVHNSCLGDYYLWLYARIKSPNVIHKRIK